MHEPYSAVYGIRNVKFYRATVCMLVGLCVEFSRSFDPPHLFSRHLLVDDPKLARCNWLHLGNRAAEGLSMRCLLFVVLFVCGCAREESPKEKPAQPAPVPIVAKTTTPAPPIAPPPDRIEPVPKPLVIEKEAPPAKQGAQEQEKKSPNSEQIKKPRVVKGPLHLFPNPPKVGMIGEVLAGPGREVFVIRVIDEKSMIVKTAFNDGRYLTILFKVPTAGAVDDAAFALPTVFFECTGTTRVEGRTMFVLEPVDYRP